MDLSRLRAFHAQIEQQCHIALANASAIEDALGAPPVDHEAVWAGAQRLLTAVSDISKALWGTGGRRTRGRRDLRESLHVSDTSPLRPTRRLTTFEHFDERLDHWWTTSSDTVDTDCVVGSASMIIGAARVDIARQMDPWTFEIVFWGGRHSLADMVHEVGRILPIAAESCQHEGHDPETDQRR